MPFELFIPTFDQAGFPLSLYPLDTIPRLLLPLNQVPVVSQQLPLAIAVCMIFPVSLFFVLCVTALIIVWYRRKISRIIQVCIIICIQCSNHCNLCMHKGTWFHCNQFMHKLHCLLHCVLQRHPCWLCSSLVVAVVVVVCCFCFCILLWFALILHGPALCPLHIWCPWPLHLVLVVALTLHLTLVVFSFWSKYSVCMHCVCLYSASCNIYH